MRPEELHRAVETLRARVALLERLVHTLATTLPPPIFDRAERGYRYGEPETQAFLPVEGRAHRKRTACVARVGSPRIHKGDQRTPPDSC